MIILASYTTTPQPEQQAEPTIWRDVVVVSLVREGINKHRARELADHFAAPPQRQWQCLTDEDVRQCSRDVVAGGVENSVDRFAYAIEAKLKERNT